MGFLVSGSDVIVLSAAFFGLLVFLVTHIIGLRGFRPQRVPGMLLGCVVLGGLGTLGSYFWLVGLKVNSALGGITSILIFSLLVFHYFSGVFGMMEAAIRIRLLLELYGRPAQSATPEEILQNYNESMILKLRLDRLVAAGHLKWNGEFYRIGNRILLIQIGIQRIVKGLFG